VPELEAENLVEISIKDSGLGISPDDKMHLFEKYYRAEEARKVNSSGTGLGLYLVKQIISQHKGKVWVDSVHGKGSTFYITLPIQAK
jgi:two-component system sensor histidine kinase VicK